MIGWDTASGRRLSAHPVTWMGDLDDHVIAPDGRSVAVANGSVVDVVSGKSLLKDGGGLSYPCAHSADSRLLATTDLLQQDRWRSIAVHELLTGRLLRALEAVVSWSSRYEFSPDGRLLIVAGADALHVWEVSTGRRLLHLPAEGRLQGWVPGTFATCLAIAPDGRSAATGHDDGTVLFWDLKPAWRQLAERPAVALTNKQLDACWSDLRDDDPRKAYAAMDHLRADPAKTLSLFRKHLQPVTIDSHWLTDRLAALDSSEFTTREKASRDLEKIADTVSSRLRRERDRTSSPEARRRLRALLDKAASPFPASETVRQLRALTVLEQIATVEARALLQGLAQGAPSARLTVAAKSAPARMVR